MMRRGRLGEQQPHRVALVAEGRLHSNKDVPELRPEDEQVLAVGVEVARRRAPVLVEVVLVGAEPLVLLHGHPVDDVQSRPVLFEGEFFCSTVAASLDDEASGGVVSTRRGRGWFLL